MDLLPAPENRIVFQAAETMINKEKENKAMYKDYLDMVKEDVKNWINENIEYIDDDVKADKDDFFEYLNDNLWMEDSVTGNGSGSYTFNSWDAENYVKADMDTVKEALHEFCVPAETIAEKFLNEDWKYFDVTARCYVLGSAIYEVLEDMESEGFFENEN